MDIKELEILISSEIDGLVNGLRHPLTVKHNLINMVKELDEVKLNLPVVSRTLNATLKVNDEVIYDGEKCKIVFIDLKTGFLNIDACFDGFKLVDINPKHCTKSI